MRSLFAFNNPFFDDQLLLVDESAWPAWQPARPRAPSQVERRGRAAGLQHWQVAFGQPRRMEDLLWLDKLFAEQGWQVADYDARSGYWPLQVGTSAHEVPTRFLLDLRDAAGGDVPRFLFGFQLFLDGKPRPLVLQHVQHCRSSLARQRMSLLHGWASAHNVWLGDWSPKALQWLARQPAVLRWALLHKARPRKENNCLPGLNWEALRQAKRSTRARLSYLPPEVLWEHLTGVAPTGLRLPTLAGFKFGTLQVLCAEFGVSLTNQRAAHVQGWLQAFVQLVRLFGDYQSIRRFVTQEHLWTLHGLHDAGQFRLPGADEPWTPTRWAALCLRHPQAVQLSQHFATVEARGVIPQSWTELRRLQFETTYTGGPQWGALKLLCGELGLSNQEYKAYQTFWEKTKVKPADFMPHINLDGRSHGLPGWRLVKLAATDLRGPMLGVMTGCCQHINGAARSCASHGVTSPFSAFYAVERNGVLVAQSWVWRNSNGGLVIDSVETKDRSTAVVDAVAALWKAAAPLMLGQLGIRALHIGDCSSGITNKVFNLLGALTDKLLSTLPLDGADYYDGRHHACWAGAHTGRKDKIPAVEGYTRTKAYPERRLMDQFEADRLLAMEEGAERFVWGNDDDNPWLREVRREEMFWASRQRRHA